MLMYVEPALAISHHQSAITRSMSVLRVYDPARTPASWTEIIRPGQFVAFVKRDTGAPCDERGAAIPHG
jgi:hypothetical protein